MLLAVYSACNLLRPVGASSTTWQIMGFFASLHIPFPALTPRSSLAGVRGNGMLGLFSRPIAFLWQNMLVAYWTADREATSSSPILANSMWPIHIRSCSLRLWFYLRRRF